MCVCVRAPARVKGTPGVGVNFFTHTHTQTHTHIPSHSLYVYVGLSTRLLVYTPATHPSKSQNTKILRA